MVDDGGAPGRVGGAVSGYLPSDLVVTEGLYRDRHDDDKGCACKNPQKSAIPCSAETVDMGTFGTFQRSNPEIAKLLLDTHPHDLAAEVLKLRRMLVAIGEDAADGLASGAGYARDALLLIKGRCEGTKKDIWDVAGSGWGTRG